jgi:hypothetical protein
MQQQEQNPMQLIDELLRKKLDETIFACDDTATQFLKEYAPKILNSHSIASIRCDLDNYRRLVQFANGEITELSLFDASRLINGFDQVPVNKLGVDLNEYLRLLECKDTIAVQWNEIVSPIKKAIEREIRAKIERKIITPANANIRTGTNLKLNKK